MRRYVFHTVLYSGEFYPFSKQRGGQIDNGTVDLGGRNQTHREGKTMYMALSKFGNARPEVSDVTPP